jgi:hypothetical protein
MQYDVRLEQFAGLPLAVVRRRARLQELSTVVPAACGVVWNAIRAQQVSGAGRHVAFYCPELVPTGKRKGENAAGSSAPSPPPDAAKSEGANCKPGELNLEIGVELAAPFGGHGEVFDSALPAGRVAVTAHLGQYSQLYHAHEAVRTWCQQQGHKLAGPSWEIYGHWEEQWNTDPNKIRTDVYWLLG